MLHIVKIFGMLLQTFVIWFFLAIIAKSDYRAPGAVEEITIMFISAFFMGLIPAMIAHKKAEVFINGGCMESTFLSLLLFMRFC